MFPARVRRLSILLTALLAAGVAACAPLPMAPAPADTAQPSPTAIVLPTASPTVILSPTAPPAEPSPTPVVLPTVRPTLIVAPTALPTAIVLPTAPPTVQPTARPTATQPRSSRVKIFLIALEDGGRSGPAIGCGDSVVEVIQEVPYTQQVLTAALNRLLSLHQPYFGESGLYTALHQSDLRIDSIGIEGGTARIALSGTLMLGGVCDNPRVWAQIEQTALQFSTVDRVVVTMNGVPLERVLSGDGGVPPATPTRPAPTPVVPTTAPPTVPPPTAGATSRVRIFLIALEDAGRSGPAIGCGDSVVGVIQDVPYTQQILTAALNRLLSLHQPYFGESGLYTALHQSDLRIGSIGIQGGTATIALTGTLRLGGVCDNPRVQAQIEQTALQFSTVDRVVVTVNGTPLATLLSGS